MLVLLGAAATAAGSLPFIASAGPGAQAPNLRADPVENINGPAVYSNTEGGLGQDRLLVRFDGFVTNIGTGPLEVSGNPQVTSTTDNSGVRQRARQFSGQSPTLYSVVGRPEVKFEYADSHNHFHLMRAMRYSLWNTQRTARVAPGQKVGFCLYDIQQISGNADPETYSQAVTQFCDQGDPGSTSLRMGTSPGWRDVYDQSLAYQWVDVSNTSPGRYVVGSEADPDNQIWEGGGANEANPPAFASQEVIVPGWVSQAVNLKQTGAAQTVTLGADKFGTQSDSRRRFKIVAGPANGTLNVNVGQSLTSPTVTYTPKPGYIGGDSFRYVALDANSSFPLTPVEATVTIADATPSVAISGAPASLVAGTSAQLIAQLANVSGGVTWTASAGTITPGGLYTAPSAVPKGGTVTIRATSTANPAVAGQVVIGITAPPKTAARPDPFINLTAGSKLLSPLKVKRVLPRVFVAKVVTGRKGGKVTMTVTRGRTVLNRKTVRLGARKGVTYRVTVRRGTLSSVRVTAKFVANGGKLTSVRKAGVPAL